MLEWFEEIEKPDITLAQLIKVKGHRFEYMDFAIYSCLRGDKRATCHRDLL